MDKVVHFHLPVNDMERAKSFYRDIFGWDIEKKNYDTYQLVKTVETDENDEPKEPGAINGALYLRESPEDCPEITIEVASIEDYIKKVEKHGGKVVTSKTQVMNMGWYAEISDTENNVVGLWENA